LQTRHARLLHAHPDRRFVFGGSDVSVGPVVTVGLGISPGNIN
jgi:hypothetical protein